MIVSFLLSFLGGLLVIPAERPIRAWLMDAALAEGPFEDKDLRILAFALLLLIAAALTWLVGADSSAYLAIAGGVLGYFTTDLLGRMRDPNRPRRRQVDKWGNIIVPETAPADAQALHAVAAADRAGDFKGEDVR